jgi:SNF2 family DNA or RNA helicase
MAPLLQTPPPADSWADGDNDNPPPPTHQQQQPMPLERAVLVRLAAMTHQHAVARAAVAHLLLRAGGDDHDAAAAHAASSSAAAAPSNNRPAPPPHHSRVLAELRSHPRVLVCPEDEGDAEAGDEAAPAPENATTTTTTTTNPSSSSLAAAVLRFHSECREAQARARLRALRANDVGAYLALLKGAREGRLRECFAQSEAVMASVLARLPATATAEEGDGNGDGGDDDDAAAWGAKAQAAWERLAARIRASGGGGGDGENEGQQPQSQQPAMLGGGGGGEAERGGAGGHQPPPPHAQRPGLRLRAYQLEGMRWMIGLKRLGLNGILADEMGLGKTVQVLAAVCSELQSYDSDLAAWAAARRAAAAAAAATGAPLPTAHVPPRPPPRRPALVLCPASVLPSWAAETQRWAPGLRLLAYTGPSPQRDALWAAAFSGGGGGSSRNRPSFDVLLVSYETLMSKRDFPRLSSLAYGWLVVDEGHRVKNADCRLATLLRQVRASCRLLLTGTPLQMHLQELWSLLDFLMPGAFGSSADFDAWFSAPLRALREAAGEVAATTTTTGGAATTTTTTSDEAALLSEEEYLLVASRLHRVLRPFVLRRVKENVAGELPRKEEHLLSCGASPYEAALAALVRLAAASAGAASSVGLLAGATTTTTTTRAAAAAEAEDGSAAAAAAPFSLSFAEAALAALRDSGVAPPAAGELRSYNNPVMELRSISNHPLLSRLHASAVAAAGSGGSGGGGLSGGGGGEGGTDDDGLLLPSGNTHRPLPPLVRLSGKFEVLDRLLARLSAPPPVSSSSPSPAPTADPHAHRVLIFSTMTRALDLAAALLERRGLSYLRLDGGTATDRRGDLAAQFAVAGGGGGGVGAASSSSSPAPPPPFAFLLSVRAGGVGLNLQAADSVIMLDSDPNPQADLQAQARAHRMGQTREVRVYRLASRADACEAHVARRCDERRRFAAAAIDAGLFDGRGGNESEMERRGVLMHVLRQPGAAGAAAGAAAAATGAQAATPSSLADPSRLPLSSSSLDAQAATADPPTLLAVLEAVAAHAARAAEAAERSTAAGAAAALPPTDDELNVMVARSPEELSMLRRRFPPAASASSSSPTLLRGGRLASAAECARLIRRACKASLRPRKREEDLSLYGRGMRRALQASTDGDARGSMPLLPAAPRPGKRKKAAAAAEAEAAVAAAAPAAAAVAVEAGAVELTAPVEGEEEVVAAMDVEAADDDEGSSKKTKQEPCC